MSGSPTSAIAASQSGPVRIVDSSATQAVRLSRMFQTRPKVPPGRSTRCTSGRARAGSTQCQAWATSTASTEASGDRDRLPAADPGVDSGPYRRSSASIGSEGSTAMVRRPRAARYRVSLPGPGSEIQHRSRAPAGRSQSSASGG